MATMALGLVSTLIVAGPSTCLALGGPRAPWAVDGAIGSDRPIFRPKFMHRAIDHTWTPRPPQAVIFAGEPLHRPNPRIQASH